MAARFLDPELRELATQWNSLTTKAVLAKAERMTELFRKPFKEEEELLHFDGKFEDGKLGFESCLPRYWREGFSPSCLGLAQILVAFAEMTQAPFRLVTVTMYNHEVTSRILGTCYAQVLKDFKKRGICTNEDILDGLKKKSWLRTSWPGQWQFHHALVIRVAEDWILVDPYCSTWCPLKETLWRTSQMDTLLLEHEKQKPGLTLPLNDGLHLEMAVWNLPRRLQRSIRQSRSLERKLQDLQGKTLKDFFKIIRESSEYKSLLRLHPLQHEINLVLSDSKDIRKSHEQWMRTWTLKLEPWEVLLAREIIGLDLITAEHSKEEVAAIRQETDQLLGKFAKDPEFRIERINFFLSRFHSWKMDTIQNEVYAREGLHPHPELEIHADPYHHLALSVMSMISHTTNSAGLLPIRVLHHSSSQLVWCAVIHAHSWQNLELHDQLLVRDIAGELLSSPLTRRNTITQSRLNDLNPLWQTLLKK